MVVWDLVDQKGLYRLKGHQGMITCCRFVRAKNMMVTSSKDSNIKWWDLDVGHCFKTIHDHRARVWQFVIDPQETTLITGESTTFSCFPLTEEKVFLDINIAVGSLNFKSYKIPL